MAQSRQTKYQHSHRKAGLCWVCNEPAVRKPDGSAQSYCVRHVLEIRERGRQRYRDKIGRRPRACKRKPPANERSSTMNTTAALYYSLRKSWLRRLLDRWL